MTSLKLLHFKNSIKNNTMTMTFVIHFNLVLAFVSMGGSDKTDGNIDCKKLIAMVKDEFKLTIDIEVIFIYHRD